MRGPYISSDYDAVYLPVADYTFNQARTAAASWAEDVLDVWGRSRYTGKQNVPLHDHRDWEECETCPAEPTWCFDVYEGTPRR